MPSGATMRSGCAVAEGGRAGGDFDEAVVFGDTLAAGWGAGLQLSAAGADGQVRDERVLGLPGAVGHELPVARAAAYCHGFQGLGDRADLVELDQRGVGDAAADGV